MKLEKPLYVSIPNGKPVRATHVGTTHIGSSLILSNGLLILELHCNLISVAKLSMNIPCQITFYLTHCVIQDHTSRRTIGVGELRGESTFSDVWHLHFCLS